MGQPLIDPEWFDEFDEFGDDCEWCYGDEPKSPGRLRRLWDTLVGWAKPKAPEVPVARAPEHEINLVGLWRDRELFRFVLTYDGAGGLRWVDRLNGDDYMSLGGDFTFVLPDEAVRLVLGESVWSVLDVEGPVLGR